MQKTIVEEFESKTQTAKPNHKSSLRLAALCACMFGSLLTYSCFFSFSTAIKIDLDLNNSQLSFVIATYFGSQSLAAIAGTLLQPIEPTRLFRGCVLTIVAMNLIFPLVSFGMTTAVLVRAIAGGAHVGILVAAVQIASQIASQKRKGLFVGLVVASGYLGTTISYGVAGIVFSHINEWRTSYLVVGAIAAAISILGLPLVNKHRVPLDVRRPENCNSKPWRKLFENRTVVFYTVAYSFHTADLYVTRILLPLYLNSQLERCWNLGASDTVAASSVISGVVFTLGIAALVATSFISDLLGRRRVVITILCSSAAVSILSVSLGGFPNRSIYLHLMASVFVGLLTSADSAIYSTEITTNTDFASRQKTQFAQLAFGFGLATLATLASGLLLDFSGSRFTSQILFGANAMFSILGVAALLCVTANDVD